jgi:hypothetical protein
MMIFSISTDVLFRLGCWVGNELISAGLVVSEGFAVHKYGSLENAEAVSLLPCFVLEVSELTEPDPTRC